MEDGASNFDLTASSERNEERNGKESYRKAPMISEPRTVRKMRVRGALVPLPREPL